MASVLFINRVYPPDQGATGRCLADLAEAFSEAGWRVTVLACGEGRETRGGVEVIRTGGNRVAAAGLSTWGYLRALLALTARAVFLRRHDVIVTMTDPPLLAFAGPLPKALWRARLLHWCHDLYPDLFPVLGVRIPGTVLAILGRAARWTMRRSDQVVAIGSCMADRLAASGMPVDRITTISNWGERIQQANAPVHSFRRKHGIEERWIILYSGNFGLAHPFEAVLDAAALLETSMPSAMFVLVGAGRRHDRIVKETARRGLSNVRALPAQPSHLLGEMFAAADLHLATMLPQAEGMLVPCKVQSAFAAARPCLFVGPRGSAAARTILDYGAGAVVESDGHALADEIRRFAQDQALWLTACSGARRAAAEHGFAVASARFLNAADRLLSGGPYRRPLLQDSGSADRA